MNRRAKYKKRDWRAAHRQHWIWWALAGFPKDVWLTGLKYIGPEYDMDGNLVEKK